MKKSPSTPPWKVVTDGFKDGFASIETEDGGYEVVLSCRKDNAELIVNAVNYFEDAVNTLYAAWQFIEDLKPSISNDDEGEILHEFRKQQNKYNDLIFVMTGKRIDK